MGEGKKPSSLRTRVQRSRKVYAQKTHPMRIVVGALVLLAMGVGLWVFVGKPERPKFKPVDGDDTGAVESTASGSSSSPSAAPFRPEGKTPKEKAHFLCFYAKQDAKQDPDKAVADLKKGLVANSGYSAEIYFTMAMALNEKIYKTKDKAAQKRLYREKVGYLEQAIDAADAGSKWTYGDAGFRRSKLDEIMEQSRKSAGM